jgi:hypothetical protein
MIVDCCCMFHGWVASDPYELVLDSLRSIGNHRLCVFVSLASHGKIDPWWVDWLGSCLESVRSHCSSMKSACWLVLPSWERFDLATGTAGGASPAGMSSALSSIPSAV